MLALSLLMPEVAASETRVLTLLEDGELPGGEYIFDEFYCVEKDCDCKRVTLSVTPGAGGPPVATFSLALTPDALGAGSGPRTVLEPFGQQSEYAAAMLTTFETLVLSRQYEERLRRHYRLVKDALADRRHPIHAVVAEHAPGPRPERLLGGDEEPPRPMRRSVATGRNDPCPCGSGKKYKRCCLGKPAADERVSTLQTTQPPSCEEASSPHRSEQARNPTAVGSRVPQGTASPPPVAAKASVKRTRRTFFEQYAPDGPWFFGCSWTPGLAQVQILAYLTGSPGAPHPLPEYPAARLAEVPEGPFDKATLQAICEHRANGWTLERARRMSLEALEAQLVAYGVGHTRERFRSEARSVRSAFALARGWIETEPVRCRRKDQLFLRVAAHELWRRLLPEEPSEEMLEDLMQEGYSLLREGRDLEASAGWNSYWSLVGSRLPAAVTTVHDDRLPEGLQIFSNWISDYQNLLEELLHRGEPVAALGCEFGFERLRRFPDDSEDDQIPAHRAIADHLFFMGRLAEGLKLLETTVERWPHNAWGYIALADQYSHFWQHGRAVPRDLARARSYLERGLKLVAGSDRDVLQERLAELARES